MGNTQIEKRVLFAFKLGEKEYMESLINDGIVYMNSVLHFRDSASDGRKDPFEGVSVVKNGVPVEYRDNIDKEKVFCMWHINNFTEPMGNGVSVDYYSDSMCEITVDTREYVNEFAGGNSDNLRVVAIHNMKEFHKRLREAFRRNSISRYDMGEIKYYNPNESSVINVSKYMKPDTLRHQNEIRYYAYSSDSKPLKIKIGNMSDIAIIQKVCEIKIQLPYSVE